MSENSSSATVARLRLNYLVGNDRFADGVELGLQFQSGCEYRTLSEIFRILNTGKVLPRWIADEFITIAPGFALNVYDFASFVKDRSKKFGFDVEKTVLTRSYYSSLLEYGIEPKRELNVVQKMFNPESFLSNPDDETGIKLEIINSIEPLAVIGQKPDIAHMVHVLGEPNVRKFSIKQLESEGHQIVGYISFKKNK